MPALANTFRVGNARGNREDLSDDVSLIDPEDTPIYSMIPKETAKNTNPEWETIALVAPGVNAQEEGDEYTFAASIAAVRLRNHTQIFRKDGILSESQNAVTNAGRAEQVERQKLMRGVELRKDVEFAILDNQPSVGGNTRRLGGLPSWYTSNVSRGATGSNGGYNTGTTLTVAATNGTQRAMTKTLIDDVMQAAYNNGANVKAVSLSPYAKRVFVGFMSDPAVATFRYAVDGGKGNTLISNVEYYHGPFGKVAILPNRVQGVSAALARNVHFLDPQMLAFKWLRKIKEDPNVARTGDAKKYVIIGEGTLAPKNQQGLAVLADIFGMTAST